MKCVQNPISGEIKRVDNAEAIKLCRYGWGFVTKAAYRAWKDKGGLPAALGTAIAKPDAVRRRV